MLEAELLESFRFEVIFKFSFGLIFCGFGVDLLNMLERLADDNIAGDLVAFIVIGVVSKVY
jgi:hypothetical protein